MANPYIGSNIDNCNSPTIGVDKATYSALFDALAAALDGHNHKPNEGKGLQIETDALGTSAVTTVKIADQAVTAAKLATAVAGAGLTGGGGTALAVVVDDATIEINSDTLRVKAAGVNLTSHVTGVLPYANGGTNASTAWTAGSILFAGASGFAQDNANFFWDDSNNRLGILTATPASTLQIASDFRVTATASAVNYLNVSGGATSSGPTLLATGSDTNVDMYFALKGSGRYVWYTGTSTERMRLTTTALGLGTATPNKIAYTGPVLTINSTTTNSAALEIGVTATDQGLTAGNIAFYATGNTSAADLRLAEIRVATDGSTANHRGGSLVLRTKLDNGALTDRLTISQAGAVSLAGTLAMTLAQNASTTLALSNTNTGSSASARASFASDAGTSVITQQSVAAGEYFGVLASDRLILEAGGSSYISMKTGGADQVTVASDGALRFHAYTTQGYLTVDTSGNVTSNSGLLGVTDGSAASAGYVGEYLTDTSSEVNFPAATGDYGDIADITLTAGDWIVDAVAQANDSAAGGLTTWSIAIGTVSGNDVTGLTSGHNLLNLLPPTTTSRACGTIPGYRMSVTTNTPVYLKAKANFTSGTPKIRGRISAHRVR